MDRLVCMGDGALLIFVSVVLFIIGFEKNDSVITRIALVIICLGLGITTQCLSQDGGFSVSFVLSSVCFTVMMAILLINFGKWASGKPANNIDECPGQVEEEEEEER